MKSVKFMWNLDYRANFYPDAEGDRRKPYSNTIWSATEAMERERIVEIQEKRLQRLLDWAWNKSPFYRQLFSEAGVHPQDVRTLQDLPKLPAVTKEDFDEMQRQNPPFGNMLTTPPGENIKMWSTTGTSGPPRLWLYSREDFENSFLAYVRYLWAAGVKPGDKLLCCANYPPSLGPWSIAYACDQVGVTSIPSGGWSTERRVETMVKLEVDAVRATPSYLLHMADAAEKMGIDLAASKVRIIISVGEPLASAPATRRLIEARWGARAFDCSGLTEGGPLLYNCQEQSHLFDVPALHFNEDYLIVEVVDPETGAVLPRDREGELCITSLFLFAMPVIRYRTKDLIFGVNEEPCPCGRTVAKIPGGLHCRASDMIIIKGVNVYPGTFENIIRATSGLDYEYRIILHRVGRFDEITLQVEARANLQPESLEAVREGLSQRIKKEVGITVDIEVLPNGTLSRLEERGVQLKAKRVIDQR